MPMERMVSSHSSSTIMQVASSSQEGSFVETIPILAWSSLYDDLISIRHDPSQASISIILSNTGRCPRPYVRGRLAGPTLIMVQDWKYTTATLDDATSTNVSLVVGTYPPPLIAGQYFIELVAIYCDNFISSDFLIQNNQSFSDTCTEPYVNRQLSDPNFKITVTQTIASTNTHTAKTVVAPGYWIHNDYLQRDQVGVVDHQQENVNIYQTRYQPPFCLRNSTEAECHLPNLLSINVLQEHFQWKWTEPNKIDNNRSTVNVVDGDRQQQQRQRQRHLRNGDEEEMMANDDVTTVDLVRQIIPNSPRQNVTVCWVGASHSRKAYHNLLATGLFDGPSQIYQNVTLRWLDVKVPNRVSPHVVREGCGIPRGDTSNHHNFRIVVAVGQWVMSAHESSHFTEENPFTFAKFHLSYRQMLQDLHAALPQTPIYARSINYSPLGNMKNQCPPSDWRMPTVVDGYNEVIRHTVREVASSSNLQFLDTDFLVGPVWDTGSDWCHFDRSVGTIQAAYIMRQVLQDVL